MKARVTQGFDLMLGALIQVSILDDGMGSVHSISLFFHQQGKGRKDDRALRGHKALPYSVMGRISSSLPYIWMNQQSISTFTQRLNIKRVLPLLGAMGGLG